MAFARFAPAVTLECGQPGSQPGLDQAVAFVEACLSLEDISVEPPAPAEIDCFQTAAVVRVPEALALSSEQAGAPIHLREDLDRFNWQRVPRNTVLARLE